MNQHSPQKGTLQTPAEVQARLDTARKFAKSSCRGCCGTGIVGHRVTGNRRTALICSCSVKNSLKQREKALKAAVKASG